MRRTSSCAGVAVFVVLGVGLLAGSVAAAWEVLERAPLEVGREAQRLRNRGFEEGDATRAAPWTFWQEGYVRVAGAGRNGGYAVRCSSDDANVQHGASQLVTLNQDRPRALVATGWSRAENVDGSPNSGYSIYLDIDYTDGSHLWGQTANFSTGTHDWERRQCVLVPAKPIESLTVHALFRGHTGTVYFDDFSLAEIAEEVSLFENVPVVGLGAPPRPTEPSRVVTLETQNGLGMSFDRVTGRVARLTLGGETVGQGGPGLFVCDAAADSPFVAPDDWTVTEEGPGLRVAGARTTAGGGCATAPQPRLRVAGELATADLRLSATLTPRHDHIEVAGRIDDLRGEDRAVTIYFALPVAGDNWSWSDDLRRHRRIEGVMTNTRPTGAGATGTRSRYPLAALSGPDGGLALAVPMDDPRHHRLGYDAGNGLFFAAFDIGLSPDAAKFPGHATYRLLIYPFDATWRFRAALARYYALFHKPFLKRVPREGLWMAFTDISTVQGWPDFGFAFHEGTNNVPWDERHDVLSFVYTEPMTHWLPLPKDVERSHAGAVGYLDTLYDRPELGKQARAAVTRLSAVRGPDGEHILGVHDAPWCDGCVFALNPDPDLPTPADVQSQGQSELHRLEQVVAGASGPALKGQGTSEAHVDGVYIDSYEFWATTLDYNRAHFASADIPLIFDAHTHRVGILTVFSTFEFEREIARRMHAQGKLMMANGVLNNFGFPTAHLDVLGTETNWFRNGEWSPLSDADLCYRRALSCQKPYCFLLNTHYADLSLDDIECYMQRALFYGMFPGFFSENAATDCFFANPDWYDPARPLFKKYVPLVQRIAQAGWQPVSHARASDDRIYLERYGDPAQGAVYLAALNEAQQTISGTVQVDAEALGWTGKKLGLRDLLSDRDIEWQAHAAYSVELEPNNVHLVRLAPQ